ncbi:MAG: FAD:protein FMN transferase, partial [Paracoccaceae bacterium]
MHRRRFLTITAGAAGMALLSPRRAVALTRWQGVALGAEASITLDHPQADRLIARARDEIARLEDVFSLYRPGSALSRLNAAGTLQAPPFELLDCLALAGRVHDATEGAFDPTIQPLWALHAEHAARGGTGAPPRAAREAVLARVGWRHVRFDTAEIRLRPGAALSLNGIAQGYIADRVADLLRAEGLTDVLVDTGEMHALGGDPRGGPWQVHLKSPGGQVPGAVALSEAALASSAPRGTTFDAAGRVGHILDPRSGRPAPSRWRLVSVMAPRAGLADALSTAFVLL